MLQCLPAPPAPVSDKHNHLPSRGIPKAMKHKPLQVHMYVCAYVCAYVGAYVGKHFKQELHDSTTEFHFEQVLSLVTLCH